MNAPNERFVREPQKKDLCALCGQPFDGEPVETASDGLLIHERCAEEYENVVYHREFESDDGDA